MGFSFRGKTSEHPIVVNETDEGISSGADIQGNPEADLKKFRKLHKFDPYLDINKLEDVDNVLATGDPEKEAVVEEQLLTEDSPYPEVRASVSYDLLFSNLHTRRREGAKTAVLESIILKPRASRSLPMTTPSFLSTLSVPG